MVLLLFLTHHPPKNMKNHEFVTARRWQGAIAISIISFLTVTSGQALESRTWTNLNGQTLEAKFESQEGDNVILKQIGGEQTLTIPMATLSDADKAYVEGLKGGASAAQAKPEEKTKAVENIKFAAALDGKLVRLDQRKPVPVVGTVEKPYYAFYYSAGWCPPCRAFTPDLVKFYNRLKDEDLEKVELIFVSSDKTEEAMAEYMREFRMKFPALAFNEKSKIPEVSKLSGRGIPSLVVVDAEGKVISDSYVGGKYRGPDAVLDELKDLLKKG